MRLPEDWNIWARGLRRNRLWEEGLSTTIGRWETEHLLGEIDALDLEQRAARAWLDSADPAVLQLEMMGQLGAWLVRRVQGEEHANIRLLRVHHALFVEPVPPGERLEILCQVLDHSGTTAVVAGQVRGRRGVASVSALELVCVQR